MNTSPTQLNEFRVFLYPSGFPSLAQMLNLVAVSAFSFGLTKKSHGLMKYPPPFLLRAVSYYLPRVSLCRVCEIFQSGCFTFIIIILSVRLHYTLLAFVGVDSLKRSTVTGTYIRKSRRYPMTMADTKATCGVSGGSVSWGKVEEESREMMEWGQGKERS